REHARLPGELDALLSRAALPVRLSLLQHGLRVGDGDRPARRCLRDHAADHRQLAALGALPGSDARMTSAAADRRGRDAVVRRTLPPHVRRRRLLLGVANHSLLIFCAVLFLAPFMFIVLTSLMTNGQALSTHLWP